MAFDYIYIEHHIWRTSIPHGAFIRIGTLLVYVVILWRSRWLLFFVGPFFGWMWTLIGRAAFFNNRWILLKRRRGEWEIHQASSPFLLCDASRSTVFSELCSFAKALKSGAYPFVEHLIIPATILSEKHLIRLGFTVRTGQISLLKALLFLLAKDELQYRASITGGRLSTNRPQYGTIERSAFIARYAP